MQRRTSRSRRERRRRRRLLGSVGCAAAAVAYLLTGWWVVFGIRIGPILTSLTPTNGVHSGDFIGVGALTLGGVFAIAAATLLGQAMLTPVRVRPSARRFA